nr:MAG: ORF1 [TTV-like mini virus]
MPWYYNYNRRYRRWPRYRRPRRFVRRRWRRRRVRRPFKYNRKLKKITVKQWQPHSIKKAKIKGLICSLQCNHERLVHNFTMYEDSIVPAHLPNGGGFSVMIFTLQNLYDQHQYVRNIWTQTNEHLPLCRYLGCSIKLYQGNIDYLFRYKNDYPMETTALSYTSTHPSVMSMLTNTIKVPSKQTQKRKRPYKKIFITPPKQLKTQWYFQHDLAKIPLLLTITSATSFDEYYISKTSESTNITIHTINTKIFQNLYFNKDYSDGYVPKTEGTVSTYLYSTLSENPLTELQTKDLIFLGDTQHYTHGEAFADLRPSAITWANYKGQNKAKPYWGNPFHPEYLGGNRKVLISNTSWSTYIINDSTAGGTNKVTGLAEITSPLVIPVRYNANKDSGEHNTLTLLTNSKATYGYHLPENPNLTQQGFPAWLSIWGFTDFIKKLKITQETDQAYMLVIKNPTISTTFPDLLPVDWTFIQGHSPYEEGPNPYDKQRWHPQLQFQEETMNFLALSGPGTPKLGTNKTLETKFQYTFHFKFGGSPAPMSTIENPRTQPYFPMPNNFSKTTSLQNPAYPIEYYLQSFDQRRDELTTKAIKRIKKDWETKDYSLQFTDGLSMHETTETHQESPLQTSEEEEEETSLFQQLQLQRAKQLRIRQRIISTLQKLQQLE